MEREGKREREREKEREYEEENLKGQVHSKNNLHVLTIEAEKSDKPIKNGLSKIK